MPGTRQEGAPLVLQSEFVDPPLHVGAIQVGPAAVEKLQCILPLQFRVTQVGPLELGDDYVFEASDRVGSWVGRQVHAVLFENQAPNSLGARDTELLLDAGKPDITHGLAQFCGNGDTLAAAHAFEHGGVGGPGGG